MANRLPKLLSIIIATLVTISWGKAFTQNITSIPGPGQQVCAGTQFVAPVMVTSIESVDSLFITVRYDPTTLMYLSERQHNALLQAAGFFNIQNPNDSTVTIKWVSADNPQTISNDKILELVFRFRNEAGNIGFDESQSYFRNTAGDIPTEYMSADIELFPLMFVTIEEIDATCPNECDANIAAYVTGGLKPYTFLWQGAPSIFDSIYAGACGGVNNLRVTDANGCVLDTNFTVSLLEASEIELITNPDTVYIQNPVIHFSFTGDQDIVDWFWDFGDGSQGSIEQSPVHVYQTASNPDIERYIAVLQVVSQSGCTDTASVSIPVSEVNLFIPNVFTPGPDDQINNYFKITKQENDQKTPIDQEFIRMELIVLDRWGRKVYDNGNYRNDWDGGNLPEGTYYYRLNTYGYFKDESYKGSVTILR